MKIAGNLAILFSIPLLGLVTFVQLLYLESMRLRTRDLPSLKYFKDHLEAKLGMKIEDGAHSFTFIKHTLLVMLGVLFLAAFADGQPWGAGAFWQAAIS